MPPIHVEALGAVYPLAPSGSIPENPVIIKGLLAERYTRILRACTFFYNFSGKVYPKVIFRTLRKSAFSY